ncbi:MAG TPA: hypothetical protein VGD45_20850 [Steroidobacter sp.]|uniref:hypothetical protein n=1 Tax=Steroidobacter sp. TaxID=1978227 RepID=UPI002ED8FCE4
MRFTGHGRWLSWSLALMGGLLPGLTGAQSETPPPALKLELKPHATEGDFDYVEGRMTLEAPKVAAGETLVKMPVLVVSIPTARYDGDALEARDDAGDLPLTIKDDPPTPTMNERRWLATRATQGDVVITFRAPPREITPTTRNGPLFDLRANGGGMTGAGVTFIPVPDTTFPYRVSLKWDLSAVAPGSRGVWSLGEGDVEATVPAATVAFSFYAAGPLNSFPAQPTPEFGMYWLVQPPVDTDQLARGIQHLYGYMSKFFHDEGQPYRVFIRKNFNHGNGGTALARSFTFGWSESTAPTLDSLQSLLAHEMTHNWPAMSGDHGDTAWYSEGAAEYYSILLSHRAGVTTLEQFQKEVNDRAAGYYTNPYVRLTNREAAKIFWSDWGAQRVPYGRGFMYLAKVDAQIRAKSGGKRSLDDLAVPMFETKKAGAPPSIDEWVQRLTAEIGPQAKRDYDDMVAGKIVVPPKGSFAPCFKVVKHPERPYVLGFDNASLNGQPKIVKGLVKGSAAAAAGLRDGDEVLEFVDPLDLQRERTKNMAMTVRRNGEQLRIEYSPRGEPATAYKWERVSGVPETECKL